MEDTRAQSLRHSALKLAVQYIGEGNYQSCGDKYPGEMALAIAEKFAAFIEAGKAE